MLSHNSGIGKPFYSILCETTREDIPELAVHVATISRGINADLVHRGAAVADDLPWPRGPSGPAGSKSTTLNSSWRGGGFADTPTMRAFFSLGNRYRVNQFLAASFDRGVAKGFIGRTVLGGLVNARVLWEVQLDGVHGCHHVNLVTDSHVETELEFLFTAYSVFTVVKTTWSADPTDAATPHKIVIKAAVNNKDEPEDLPLAPWC